MILAVSLSPPTVVDFILILPITNGVGRIKARICHFLFTKGKFNMVETFEYGSMIEKLSYLK